MGYERTNDTISTLYTLTMIRYLIFLLLILAGCTTAATPTPITLLPTPAIVADVPTAMPPPLAPTWTAVPSPTSSPDQSFLPAVQSGAPTSTAPIPTNTRYIPTNTATPTATATATATPPNTATPTPYVLPIPTRADVIGSGGSKLGVHVIRMSPGGMDFIREAKPVIVKAVDDFGFLAEVKQISPSIVTIGRMSANGIAWDESPEQSARDFVETQLEQYELNPYVDYWEGWNEPDPGLERMDWYARFEAERVRQMTAHGFKTAVGGFSTGVPEMDEFERFVPAVEVALAHGGILSLHEYSAPDLYLFYGDPMPPNWPAHPNRGSLMFRYRWYYEEFLLPRGLYIPLAITEAGIDGVIGNRPGPQGTGWKDFQGYWADNGMGEDGIGAYLEQLAWYDEGLRQDGYVIGATLFTAGAIGHWKEYAIEPILPRLAEYINGTR